MRRPLAIFICATLAATPLAAQTINFGDDSSEWPNDGECDDRRFIGSGMALDLDNDDTGSDASDCMSLFNEGRISLVDPVRGQQVTQCDAIDFGNDTSEWAKDGECDDPRFDGLGSASVIMRDDLLRDATDCRSACTRGSIWLRVSGE